METFVFPFSFREHLRHAGIEPVGEVAHFAKAQRSSLGKRISSLTGCQ